MALADLLRAIEAEAAAERARADRETAAEAAAIVERARDEARTLEAALTSARETEAHADAVQILALARLDAASALRSTREDAFGSLLSGVSETLEGLRATDAYPALFEALLAESRAALPAAGELHVDRRDAGLARLLADGLGVQLTLDTWGGLELASEDGRTLRNTLEERLANAEPLLRRRFAEALGRR